MPALETDSGSGAPTPTGGGTGTRAATPTSNIGEQGILAIGLLVGLFVIPPLARSSPVVVNGFLTLVLLGSLLYNRERWLPYLAQFSGAVGGGTGHGGSAKRK